jgi:hypothetical protein
VALAYVDREARGDGSRQLGQIRVLLSLQGIEILGAPPVNPLAPLERQRRDDRHQQGRDYKNRPSAPVHVPPPLTLLGRLRLPYRALPFVSEWFAGNRGAH